MNVYIAVILGLIFLFTPFSRGLFFDTDFYWIHAVIFGLFIVWTIANLVKKERIPMVYYAIFLIPLVYLISLFVSETPRGAFDNVFRWLNFSAFFVLLLAVSQHPRVRAALPYVFTLLGMVLTVFAVLGYYKLVDYKDVILPDPEGNLRFTSVFQYGNTFAAVLGAFWLFSLVWLTDRQNPLWKMILLASPMALYSLEFFHTYSRGALLVFPIAWFVGLVLLPFHRQVLYTVYTILSTLGGLMIFRDLQDSSPVLLIGITAVTAAIIVLISWVDKRYGSSLEKVNRIRFSQLFLALLAVGSAVALYLDIENKGLVYQQLPVSFQERVSDISFTTYSVQGRSLFFDDALKISQEHPILGVGGEGWRVLFTHVQEVPYWSNETHNGYLEVLLNTGWLGLVVFCAVFGILFSKVFHNLRHSNETEDVFIRAAIPALLMIFIHSFIDFNFSYGTVWYLILVLLAMALPVKEAGAGIKKSVPYYSLQASLILVMVVFSFYVLNFHSAQKLMASIQNGKVTEVQIESLISKNPYEVQYQNIAAEIYMQLLKQTKDSKYKQKVIDRLAEIENLEPNNARAMFMIGVRYLGLGDHDKGLVYLDKTLHYDHFNVEHYQRVMDIKSQLMQSSIKDKVKTGEYAASLLADYERMEEWNQKIEENPVKINERNFHIPASVKLHAGQALLVQHQYGQLIPLIESIQGDPDAKLQSEAKALLAAVYSLTGNQAKTQEMIQAAALTLPDFQEQVAKYVFFVQQTS